MKVRLQLRFYDDVVELLERKIRDRVPYNEENTKELGVSELFVGIGLARKRL